MSLKYKKNIRNLTIFFYMYPMDTKKLYFKEGGGASQAQNRYAKGHNGRGGGGERQRPLMNVSEMG